MKLQAGFSLAELMAALAIATIVLGGLVAVHERSRHFAAQAESIAELADVGRFAWSYVATDLRHAGFMAWPVQHMASTVSWILRHRFRSR
jgi:prepilin-type N-terminal cleavage/methylation domain-containing protein